MSLVSPSFSQSFLNLLSSWSTDSFPLASTLIMEYRHPFFVPYLLSNQTREAIVSKHLHKWDILERSARYFKSKIERVLGIYVHTGVTELLHDFFGDLPAEADNSVTKLFGDQFAESRDGKHLLQRLRRVSLKYNSRKGLRQMYSFSPIGYRVAHVLGNIISHINIENMNYLFGRHS